MGYHRAGFDVVGVDNVAQPRYPFEFHQADALTFPLEGYDVIHASPPCQAYSRMRHLPWLKGCTWPALIDVVRTRLAATDAVWVIENVEDAPLQGMVLCGQSFGLPVYRHRRFESNILLLAPPHTRHREVIQGGRWFSGNQRHVANGYVCAPAKVPRVVAQRALGIDWMTAREMGQAIPPAYTCHIGLQVMCALNWHDPSAIAAQEREEQT